MARCTQPPFCSELTHSNGPNLSRRARLHIKEFRESGLISRLEVRLASPDKGLGLFAREDIPTNTYLIEYVGQLLPRSQVRATGAQVRVLCRPCIALVRSRRHLP